MKLDERTRKVLAAVCVGLALTVLCPWTVVDTLAPPKDNSAMSYAFRTTTKSQSIPYPFFMDSPDLRKTHLWVWTGLQAGGIVLLGLAAAAYVPKPN